MRFEYRYLATTAIILAVFDFYLVDTIGRYYPSIMDSPNERLVPLNGPYWWLLAVLLWMYLVRKTLDKKTLAPHVLIGGGLLGNTLSYLNHGKVIDFIPLIYGIHTNLADLLITAGIIYLLFSLRGTQTQRTL